MEMFNTQQLKQETPPANPVDRHILMLWVSGLYDASEEKSLSAAGDFF